MQVNDEIIVANESGNVPDKWVGRTATVTAVHNEGSAYEAYTVIVKTETELLLFANEVRRPDTPEEDDVPPNDIPEGRPVR